MVTIEHFSEDTLKAKGVFNWPIWQKEISTFDWEYNVEEHCYFIEGDVEVITPEKTYHIKKGDYVIFKKGLKCTWKVNQPVKKHYNFY